MAQYFRDFSEYAEATLETAAEWSRHHDGVTAGWSLTVTASDTVETAASPGGTEYNAWAFTEAGSTTGDIEVYARFKLDSWANAFWCPPCLLSTADTDDGYACMYYSGWYGQYINDGATTGTNIGGPVATPTATGGNWYKCRVRRSGSTIEWKIWADADGEPASYTGTTNTTITTVYAGLSFRDSHGDVSDFGVGTAGDAAPTSAVGGSIIPQGSHGISRGINPHRVARLGGVLET